MSVPIKRLDELIRRVHPDDRRAVEAFMEFIIAGGFKTTGADGHSPNKATGDAHKK